MSVLEDGLRAFFSPEQLARLSGVVVGLAGAGGLGSNVAMLLARSGVRRFVVADGDRVEPSNLNRQFFWPQDVGKPKARALREHLLALDPGIAFEARVEWLVPETVCRVFAGCGIVVEALDQAEKKAGICSALLGGGFFVVAASGLAGFGLPPMQVRRLGEHFVCVGDFSTAAEETSPPLAPRVMQAAALQADVVLSRILSPCSGAGGN